MDAASSLSLDSFITLLEDISRVVPQKARSSRTGTRRRTPLDIFTGWVSNVTDSHTSTPPGVTSALFRLLFPEEDARRKYDLRETKLAQYLIKIFPSAPAPLKYCLINWNAESGDGCLGIAVKDIMESTLDTQDVVPQTTLHDLDALLDELASTSAFSAHSVRTKHPRTARRPRLEILSSIYSRLSPSAGAFVTQIILKDLRPVLYPVRETHYTAALKEYNTTAVTPLSKEDAMKIWDPTGVLLRAYKSTNSFEDASKAHESGIPTSTRRPQLGSPVQIPKCRKGQGCAHALQMFAPTDRVWAETKYDGERAQIHVQIRDGKPHISIFSKSRRDSTWDRATVHPIIRRILGFEDTIDEQNAASLGHRPRHAKIRKNIILEAEMVAFSDELNQIDEFCHIRELIESTALGVRGTRSVIPAVQNDDSQAPSRHLALVFFDLLLLDDASLLSAPYATRRALLESLIVPEPGYAMIAERTLIGGSDIAGEGEERLRQAFARTLARCEEGVVLKAERGVYEDWRSPWVKLKKDYIPGYGDALDLALLAARWDKERARELRVPPGTFTTFYLAAPSNPADCEANLSAKPDFQVLFEVSYGLSRDELEHLNFMIRSSDSFHYRQAATQSNKLPYTFSIPRGMPEPEVILSEPLAAEVFGAGFTKEHSTKHYALRFPRLTKIHRRSERSWRDGTSLDAYDAIALAAVGRDRPGKDVDDWCNGLWGKAVSPGVACPVKRKRAEEVWREKLARTDGSRRTGEVGAVRVARERGGERKPLDSIVNA